MTYFLRGTLVSLAMFFLVYVVLSIVVALGWRAVRNRHRIMGADLLFGMRMFPFASALAAVALLIVPSFLYLEPLRNDEAVGISATVLACGGIVVLVYGSLSALWAWWNTFRFASSCENGRQCRLESGILAVEISAPGPVFLVAGIWSPTFFISRQARELLDVREMQVAIRHERAHVKFRDNLKKLLLRLCRFPFLSELERSWVQAAELAADDAAAQDESSALDLASALLKIASGPLPGQMPPVAMNLVRLSDSALRARVERLLAWQPRTDGGARRFHPGPMTVLLLALLIATYLPLLGQIHELTEMLVR